jgi:hypothetical protein
VGSGSGVGLRLPKNEYRLGGAGVNEGPAVGMMLFNRWFRPLGFRDDARTAGPGRGVAGSGWIGRASGAPFTGVAPCGPGEPRALGPGVGAVPLPGVACGCGIFMRETVAAVANGLGVETACNGASVAEIDDGAGAGVTGAACGAAVGSGFCVGATVGAAEGLGGAAVGGTFMLAAMTLAGALVGAAGGIGAGVTANCACVGDGLGAEELTGAGVGFGGAVGAFFANS